MSTSAQTEMIAKQFGLESIPESVCRLGRLVSRPDATLEEVATIIAQDQNLAAALLRLANPRAQTAEDYAATTVEEALQRTGMGSAMFLAMHDLFLNAVHKTFRTMLELELKQTFSRLPIEGHHVFCEICFSGKAKGAAGLRLMPESAQCIAARMLGIGREELNSTAAVDDVIGELTNMVVGNFKSNLCDAGLDCKLHPPAVRRTDDFVLRVQSGNLAQRLGLSAPEVNLLVELHVDPWSD